MVAHPDDETLWAGGTILLHPEWRCSVFTLCRASDPDRAPRFRQALERLGAAGAMADLDDGPQQHPLPDALVQGAISRLVGEGQYDLLITHSPRGEYTRHRRHTEIFSAVSALYNAGRIRAKRLWLFAYEDGGGAYPPRAMEDASLQVALPQPVWEEKHRIIHGVYGFAYDSWEARTTPQVEAFWCFESPAEVAAWLGGSEGWN